MMKAPLVICIVTTLIGYSATTVQGRTTSFAHKSSLRTFPHLTHLGIDNHLLTSNLIFPITNHPQSLWYGAVQTQLLYRSLGSLVSIGSGYKQMIMPYLICAGHIYTDFRRYVTHPGYYAKLNLGFEAHYLPGMKGTINLYLPFQNLLQPKSTYIESLEQTSTFQGHHKIHTVYLEQNRNSIDTQLRLTRFNSIEPFLGGYYHQQTQQDSIKGITIGAILKLIPQLQLRLQYSFDSFHKHYIRLGFQVTHNHDAIATNEMQKLLWQSPMRHISPLDLKTSQTTPQQYFFFKDSDQASVLQATQATFEDPSPVLTKALVDRAGSNAILMLEKPKSLIKTMDALIQTIGEKAQIIYPDEPSQVVQSIKAKKDLKNAKMILCNGLVELFKITQSGKDPIFVLSKFPYQTQEFSSLSNEEVSLFLKPGQQFQGTIHNFSENPRYPFERPTIRKVLHLADNNKLNNINLAPLLHPNHVYSIIEKDTNAMSTNTGIIIHKAQETQIEDVDLLGSITHPYRTGVELEESPGNIFQNITIRNANTGISAHKSPNTIMNNLIIGSTFKVASQKIALPTTQVQYGITLRDSDNTAISGATINSHDIGIDAKRSYMILGHNTIDIGDRSLSKIQAVSQNKRSTLSGVSGITAIRISDSERLPKDPFKNGAYTLHHNTMNIYAGLGHAYITAVHVGGALHLQVLENYINYFIDQKNKQCKPQYVRFDSPFNSDNLVLTHRDNQYKITGPAAPIDMLQTHPEHWVVENGPPNLKNTQEKLWKNKMPWASWKKPQPSNLTIVPPTLPNTLPTLSKFNANSNANSKDSSPTLLNSAESAEDSPTQNNTTPDYYIDNIKEKLISQQYLDKIKAIYEGFSDEERESAQETLKQYEDTQSIQIEQLSITEMENLNLLQKIHGIIATIMCGEKYLLMKATAQDARRQQLYKLQELYDKWSQYKKLPVAGSKFSDSNASTTIETEVSNPLPEKDDIAVTNRSSHHRAHSALSTPIAPVSLTRKRSNSSRLPLRKFSPSHRPLPLALLAENNHSLLAKSNHSLKEIDDPYRLSRNDRYPYFLKDTSASQK